MKQSIIMERSEQRTHEVDIDVKELFEALLSYKWSILFTSLLILLATGWFLYFKTPVYSSYAIIEATPSGSKSVDGGDLLGSAFGSVSNTNVNKEIEILQTFNINNYALNKVDFHTQYFIDEGFKKIELYDDLPIQVKNVTVFYKNDLNIINMMIKLIPVKGGYHLQVENLFKNKMLHWLLDKEIIKLDDQKIYHYGNPVKTDYFELMIEKKDTIDQPLYFVIKGDNRQIYEGMIKNNLTITQPNPGAPLINVAYENAIPKRANTYVNTLIDVFIQQSVAEKTKGNDRIIDFINNQLRDIKTKLDNSEKKLESYRIKNQAIDPKMQAQTYISELSKIDIELSQNELKELLIQEILKFAKENKDLEALAPYLIQLDDQSTIALITKLQEAQIAKVGIRTQYSERHPGYLAALKQIQIIKKKIILNIRTLRSSMLHRNENLKKLKESYDKKLASLPTQERTLINLKRDYEVSSETYNYLLKKKSENEMLKVAILSDYRVIDYAYNDYQPIGLKSSVMVFAALILGIILGVVQALIRHFLNDKIQNKKDIENLTTIPIYGILPALKQKVLKLEVFKDPKSPFAESYRSLRTNLQFTRKENQANVILITSTIAGEGKSTTAANLGAIFQMADYRSIVINLDLRKPTLHHYFNVANSAGMSTYLSGKSSIGEIIQSTDYENLDIIASGPIPPNPSELIITDKLDRLFNDLKDVYDYIFIDSAPLGLVTDTMHLMQYADTSLIVFRENYAKKSFITDLNNLVRAHDLKHIGIIINSVDISSGGSYGYGYGYGYGYDTKK
jgi:capsular exopolysaccharide synthesis family protein